MVQGSGETESGTLDGKTASMIAATKKPMSREHAIGAAEATRLREAVEEVRRTANAQIERSRRATFGQFLTPPDVAGLMASMFLARRRHIRLLDPGAGVGSLTAAFVARIIERESRPQTIAATAYEIDSTLATVLEQVLEHCREAASRAGIRFEYQIRREDYLADRAGAEAALFAFQGKEYDCVIMNPPYRKIHSRSASRRHLREAGIEASNLYAGFLLLAARQLRDGGELVSINPRSFCNGPYFRPFRREFLNLMAIRRLHVFESRSDVFKEDEVLQENVIIHGIRRREKPKTVKVSCTGTDGRVLSRVCPYAEIIAPNDPDTVVHIPVDGDAAHSAMRNFQCTLEDLRLQVSTGRVVDFRARAFLRSRPGPDTVPLVYPTHLRAGLVEWPNGHTRKPNAIVADEGIQDQLVPSGFYVLTKRFSAKEERRRIVAAVFDPRRVSSTLVGFENHLNYFHRHGGGLPETLARGLAVFLNSTVVDQYFRRFSGHTQLNAADLRRLPYPSEEQLRRLGHARQNLGDQACVDAAMESLIQAC